MNNLFKSIFFIFMVFVNLSTDLWAETILYKNEELKVYFTLNKTTHEATIGIEESGSDHNALIYPEIGSPEWNTDYYSQWNNIVIPEKIINGNVEYIVTSVASKAFYKTVEIKQISLPSTIRSIGSYAFGYCVNLQDFDFPENLESIGSYAFELCRNITKANLKSNVKTIGVGAFHDCTGLKEVTIPKSCTVVEDEAFNWCTSIETIIIEDSPQILKMGKCWEKGISYEGTAGYCLRGMFGDAERLKHFHWGRDMELQSHSNGRVYAPLTYTTNFYNGTSGAQMPGTVSVDKVTFGEYVKVIPRNAFAGGSIKEQLEFPMNLERIEEEAFSDTFLENTLTLTIPSSLQYFGSACLDGPNGLEPRIIYFESSVPPSTAWNNSTRVGYPFFKLSSGSLLICVPKGAADAYKSDDFWGRYTIVDPNDDIVKINVKTEGSLYGRLLAQGKQVEDISRLQIQGNLNSDDWTTIKLMSSLYELDLENASTEEIIEGMIPSTVSVLKLPQNLKTLGENALWGYPITGTLEIPSSCSLIERAAVAKLLISNLILPDNGVVVEDMAFAFNYNLKEVTIGNVNIEGNQAFWSSGVEKVTLTTGCNITGKRIFDNCVNLKRIEIDGVIENLGTETFAAWRSEIDWEECTLEDIIINGRVKKSGSDIFFTSYPNSIIKSHPIWNLFIKDLPGYLSSSFEDLCSSPMNYAKNVTFDGGEIESVEFPEDIEEISTGIFRNCSFIKHVKLPSELRKIGTAAFEGCSINEISLPDMLKIISQDAFKGCADLTEISIPVSVEEIQEGAFQNCGSLLNVNAYYNDPITLAYNNNDNPFNNVNSECCLHIPLGTAGKYRSANWKIPKIQESGCLKIIIEGSGEVKYNDNIASTGESIFWFQPYSPFELIFTPAEGNKLKSVIINGVPSTQALLDYSVLFDDPDTDLNILVEFGKSYMIGDTNADEVVNIADAVNTAKYIVDLPTTNFIFEAADINKDECITVSDVTSIVSMVLAQDCNGISVHERNVPSLNITPFDIEAGKSHSVTINLTASQPIVGIQGQIRLPEGLNIEKQNGEWLTLTDELASSHSLIVNRNDYGIVKFVCFSNNNACINQSNGVIRVNLKASEDFRGGKILIDNVIFSGESNVDISVDKSEYDVICIVPVSEIKLSTDNISLKVGEKSQLYASIFPSDATDQNIIWMSSDENKVSIDNNGYIEAISVGDATITAICGDIKASCEVTVLPILIESLTINPMVWKYEEGDKFKITATLLPENATSKELEFRSSDSSIADVDSEGNVTLFKNGSCIITVSTLDGSNLSAECVITSSSGIEKIYDRENVLVDVYNLNGVLLKRACKQDELKQLKAGTYILRNGGKAFKVVIDRQNNY